MKKVEFLRASEIEVDVIVKGDIFGTLKFGDEEFGTQKNIWILWPIDIDDGVSYFDDLEETEETIEDEIIALDKGY